MDATNADDVAIWVLLAGEGGGVGGWLLLHLNGMPLVIFSEAPAFEEIMLGQFSITF